MSCTFLVDPQGQVGHFPEGQFPPQVSANAKANNNAIVTITFITNQLCSINHLDRMSVYSAIKSHWLYLHAVATGCFGFLATIVGAHFFKMSEPIWYICLGVAVYLLTNQVMLKFQFNSYQANGATVTTTLVFVTQAVCIAGWTVGSISSKWLLGVACIIAGTYLLKTSTEEQHHSTCKEEDNCNNSKSQ